MWRAAYGACARAPARTLAVLLRRYKRRQSLLRLIICARLDMGKTRKNFYAVRVGREVGVYNNWWVSRSLLFRAHHTFSQRVFSGVCVAGRSARPRSPGTPGLSTRAFRVRLRQSHMWGPQDPTMLGLPMATLGGPTTTTQGPATDSSSTQSLSAGEPSHGPVLCEKELSFPYTFHIFTTVSNNFQFACKELLWFSCALLCSASLYV